MNRLFIANKPTQISSNHFLGRIKRKYGVKKAGYSGTLDPFAQGALLIAFGQYSRLFRFLPTSPKQYRATLWLGTSSQTLDHTAPVTHHPCSVVSHEAIAQCFESLLGTLDYTPPKYSAKKIAGKRAYALARANESFSLNTITSEIYSITLLNYSHPFLHFEIAVSEGSYIRSIAQIIAKKLGAQDGILSALTRVSEGSLCYNNEQALNAFDVIALPQNQFKLPMSWMLEGKKMLPEHFTNQTPGRYKIDQGESFAILEVEQQRVHYLINKMPHAHTL